MQYTPLLTYIEYIKLSAICSAINFRKQIRKIFFSIEIIYLTLCRLVLEMLPINITIIPTIIRVIITEINNSNNEPEPVVKCDYLANNSYIEFIKNNKFMTNLYKILLIICIVSVIIFLAIIFDLIRFHSDYRTLILEYSVVFIISIAPIIILLGLITNKHSSALLGSAMLFLGVGLYNMDQTISNLYSENYIIPFIILVLVLLRISKSVNYNI